MCVSGTASQLPSVLCFRDGRVSHLCVSGTAGSAPDQLLSIVCFRDGRVSTRPILSFVCFRDGRVSTRPITINCVFQGRQGQHPTNRYQLCFRDGRVSIRPITINCVFQGRQGQHPTNRYKLCLSDGRVSTRPVTISCVFQGRQGQRSTVWSSLPSWPWAEAGQLSSSSPLKTSPLWSGTVLIPSTENLPTVVRYSEVGNALPCGLVVWACCVKQCSRVRLWTIGEIRLMD